MKEKWPGKSAVAVRQSRRLLGRPPSDTAEGNPVFVTRATGQLCLEHSRYSPFFSVFFSFTEDGRDESAARRTLDTGPVRDYHAARVSLSTP